MKYPSFLPKNINVGHALADFDGDGFGLKTVFGYPESDNTGFGIEGALGVEDEVADAVIDRVTMVILDGLEGMGMVTDQGVGTCHDQAVGLETLTGYGLECVFAAPVEADDDDGCGIGLAKPEDALQK